MGLRFAEGDSKDDFTDVKCMSKIRKFVELHDLSIHIINKSFWTMAAQSARQYCKGRVFLVGDAAHRLPPTGGFGMNTGIQDAHNLAWKLTFVLKYHISGKLLGSYEEERAPIAEQNIKWSAENAKRYVKIGEALRADDTDKLKDLLVDQQYNLNDSGLDLGFIY